MLIGQYQHNIDPKGRVKVPARLAADLGDSFVVTRGLDGCLFVYPLSEWETLEEKIRALPLGQSRDLQRFFLGNAAPVEPDTQGRMLIPQILRGYARLTRDVVVVGVGNRAEIWDKEIWEKRCADTSEEAVVAAMTELGF